MQPLACQRRSARYQGALGIDYFHSMRTDVYMVAVYRKVDGTDSTGKTAVASISQITASSRIGKLLCAWRSVTNSERCPAGGDLNNSNLRLHLTTLAAANCIRPMCSQSPHVLAAS
jgi:hypothetical protein